MSSLEQIVSQCGTISLRIVAEDDGTFSLDQYELRCDKEEDVTYWIHCLPKPGGRYASADLAKKEAIVLLRAS